jgi:hypothetical protein
MMIYGDSYAPVTGDQAFSCIMACQDPITGRNTTTRRMGWPLNQARIIGHHGIENWDAGGFKTCQS